MKGILDCLEKANNRVCYVCLRAADLRKGKPETELSQKEAFVRANKEWRLLVDGI